MISMYSEASLSSSDLPNDEDRRFQKEKLLENVHNAVKQVQNFASDQNGMATPLGIQDKCVQQLCQELDLLFLHGLRHIANGYWMFVREFTHKASVDCILELEHVKTNLGRGRAWLYMALNEGALESYLRSFITNSILIDRYYIEQAFFRDAQRAEMLKTLVAGLEFIVMELEMDSSFLDQSIIPPSLDESLLLNKDWSLSSLSLSSSILSQESNDSLWRFLDFKTLFRKQSRASLESPTSYDGDSGIGTMENSQLNNSQPVENGRVRPVEDRVWRVLAMDLSDDSPKQKTEDGMEEVVVVQSTRRRRKKKPSKKNSLKEFPSVVVLNASSESEDTHSTPSSSDATPTEIGGESLMKIEIDTSFVENDAVENKSEESLTPVEKNCDETQAKTTCEMKPALKMREDQNGSDRRNPAKRVSFEIDMIANDINMNFYSNGKPESAPPTPTISVTTMNASDEEIECNTPSDVRKLLLASSETADGSIYNKNLGAVLEKKAKSKKSKLFFNGLALRYDEKEMQLQSKKFEEKLKQELQEKKVEVDHNIKVDNNTLLKLMLSVFIDEDETIFKMYHGSVGHTEDKLQLVFIVLTDRRLYLIEHGLCQRHYYVSKVIDYEELEYLSVGLNYQMVTVVCIRRRKHYTFCTADENLTRSIISNLEIAIRRRCGPDNVPNVFTDATMQVVGLKKWLSCEMSLEANEVEIDHYVLVHWEDPQSPSSPQCPAGPSKEGHLMFCFHVHEPLSAPAMQTAWMPGYFVLKAGVLYQFTEKGSHDLQMYMRLHSPDFRGCRRIPSSKRPYVFELLLDVGKVIHLAAADDYEASQWMQAFLETIAQKMLVNTKSLHAIIPRFYARFGETLDENYELFKSCCLVLTSQKLFVCQEDLELLNYTTLGSADLINVNKVQVDSEEPRYCILEFDTLEANVCASDWILYFNSENEKNKFFNALEDSWQNVFKLPLEKTEVNDESLQKKCRDRVQVFSTSWKLGYDMLREPIAVIENLYSKT